MAGLTKELSWEMTIQQLNKKFNLINKQAKMCSVIKQRSKQRHDVGWLVLLVSDELSLVSARRRLTRGVAPGRRQTVEAATGQTRWHGRRSRDVSDWSMATAC